jgi:hypothetical protein
VEVLGTEKVGVRRIPSSASDKVPADDPSHGGGRASGCVSCAEAGFTRGVAKHAICGFVHSIRIGTRSWRGPDLVRRVPTNCEREAST